MSRTFVPDPGRIRFFVTRKQILKEVFESLKYVQADYDKAGEMQDWFYYEGARDAYAHVIRIMTVEEGVTCRQQLSSFLARALRFPSQRS